MSAGGTRHLSRRGCRLGWGVPAVSSLVLPSGIGGAALQEGICDLRGVVGCGGGAVGGVCGGVGGGEPEEEEGEEGL